LAYRVRQGVKRWPEAERDRVHVVFSAHSPPTRILKTGDPYDSQLRETARLVAERAGLSDEQWSWSYQSAGRTPALNDDPLFIAALAELIHERAASW